MIAIYAFNASNILEWPPPGPDPRLVPEGDRRRVRPRSLPHLAQGRPRRRPRSRSCSARLASLAVARHRFFGRETISFLVILPIALPGIVTGVALSNTFTQVLGIDLGLFTVIVGHATFCIVVVYNNVVARLRRISASFEEASADLGAHTWQTFRFVTLPSLRTALAAGGLLAFALSFDEIIVTTFTIGAGEETLPIWIFRNLFRPNQLPIVNVVAVLVVLISIVPVYLAHRLTREEGGAATGGRGGGRRVEAEATAVPVALPTATPRWGEVGYAWRASCGLLAAEVRRQGQLDQVGQQLLQLLGAAGADLAHDQGDDAADQGRLGRLGQRPLAAVLGPARLEDLDEALHRGAVRAAISPPAATGSIMQTRASSGSPARKRSIVASAARTFCGHSSKDSAAACIEARMWSATIS